MITTLLGAICFAVFFIEITSLNQKLGLKFKPFNCVPCLATWSAVLLYIAGQEVASFTAIVFGAGVLAPVIVQLIRKLL